MQTIWKVKQQIIHGRSMAMEMNCNDRGSDSDNGSDREDFHGVCIGKVHGTPAITEKSKRFDVLTTTSD